MRHVIVCLSLSNKLTDVCRLLPEELDEESDIAFCGPVGNSERLAGKTYHMPLAFTTDAPAEVGILERTDLTTFTTIRRKICKFQENKGDDAAPQSSSSKDDPPQKRFALFSYLLKILVGAPSFAVIF